MPTVPLLTTTGQTWDGSNCTGSPSGMSWNNGNVISIPTGYTSSVTCKRNSFNLSGLSDAASTYSKLKFEIAQLNASV